MTHPPVLVEYFTDPLCSWSWALEAGWRRVLGEHDGCVGYRYRMGGLLQDWSVYRDPINVVSGPAQMAPAWYLVRKTTGVALDEALWKRDPPESSFPPCIAVKAAEMQGAAAGERYLRRLREAAALAGRNIARPEVLVEVAVEMADEDGLAFDAARFASDLTGEAAHDRFADDLRETRRAGISRFPSLIFRGPQGSRLVVGFRPHAMLEEVLAAVGAAPPPRPALLPGDYMARWHSATAAELALATGGTEGEAARWLEEEARGGRLAAAGDGPFRIYRVRRPQESSDQGHGARGDDQIGAYRP